jgi:hypothetical protein
LFKPGKKHRQSLEGTCRIWGGAGSLFSLAGWKTSGKRWRPALGGAEGAGSGEAESLLGKKKDMRRIQKEPG